MHTESVESWLHDHAFGQDSPKFGERRTLVVVVITCMTMAAEIAAGLVFGSMALLADGMHMGSHASALSVSAFAYYYTRRHARDPRFNFGTGKVTTLAAFASAVLLAIFALIMAWESVRRLAHPVPIHFNQAIVVALIGLAVNATCLAVFRKGDPCHEQAEGAHRHGPDRHGEHEDLNLRSARLHVSADALTSVLAIAALLGGKYLGWGRLDPLMGVLGAALVTRWSWGLIRSSTHILLDMQVPEPLQQRIRKCIAAYGDERVTDLHVWAVGPGIYAGELALVASSPRAPEDYAKLLPRDMSLVHMTIEVHRCPSREGPGPPNASLKLEPNATPS